MPAMDSVQREKLRNALIRALLHDEAQQQSLTPVIHYLLQGKAGTLTLRDFQRLMVVTKSNWAEATVLLQELQLRDLQPSVPQWQRDHGWVTMACEKAGQWQKALDLLKKMVTRRLEANHVAQMATAWRLRDGAGEAGRQAASLGQLNPELRKTLVLRLYTAKGRKDARDVATAAETLRSYGAPKPRDYIVLLSAYGEVQLWQSALDILKEMHALQFAPYIVSYNAALMACEKGHQWRAALALYQDMQNLHLPPDQVSFTTLIRNVGEQKLWDCVLQLLAMMDRNHTPPDVVAYSAAMTALGKARKWWLAVGLLAELEAGNLFPDEVPGLAGLKLCAFQIYMKGNILVLFWDMPATSVCIRSAWALL